MSIEYDKKMVERVAKIKKDELLKNNKTLKRRFLLEIRLKNKKNNGSVVVIMMNPSEADKNISDRTTNKVVKYVYINPRTKNYGRLVLLNLFVAYDKTPKNVNDIIKETDFDFVIGNKKCENLTNDEYIERECASADLIILAWGKGKIINYRDRANHVLRLIPLDKAYCIKDLTITGYPRHPRGWCYTWELVKYKESLSIHKKQKGKHLKKVYQ